MAPSGGTGGSSRGSAGRGWQGSTAAGSFLGAEMGMLRRQSPRGAAGCPRGGGSALGGRGRTRWPLRGGGGSTPASSTREYNSRPVPTFPWEMRRGCLFGDRTWAQTDTSPGGAFPPALCLGTLRGIWGAAPVPPGSSQGRRYRPAGPGMQEGSGEPRRLGTHRGSPGPFRRGRGGQMPPSSGDWRPRGRLFRCSEQRPQSAAFRPQNERGARAGRGAGPYPARGCAPSVGRRRGHFCRFRCFFALAGGRCPGLPLPGHAGG